MRRVYDIFRSRLTLQMYGWFAGISLIPLFLTTFYNYKNAESELTELTSQNLSAIATHKADQITAYIDNHKVFTETLALTTDIKSAFESLHEVDANDGPALNSPQMIQSRENFMPPLRSIIKNFDFSHLYLVNTNGNINLILGEEHANYSNLIDGPLRETNLAEIFNKTLDQKESRVSELTFNPKSNSLVLYFSTPIYAAETLVGVLILQLPASNIHSITQNYSGLGDSGETLVAINKNMEYTLVNPSRHVKQASPLYNLTRQGLKDSAVENALHQEPGVAVLADYRGSEVTAAWTSIPFMDWGLVVKMDKSETHQPIYHIRKLSLLIGSITLLIVLIAAVLVASSITKPITNLTRVAGRIALGDLTADTGRAPNNEIGLLSRAIKSMALKLKTLVGQVKNSSDQVGQLTEDIAKTLKEQRATANETGSAALEIKANTKKISTTARELTGTMDAVSKVAQDTALLAESGIDGLHLMDNTMGDLAEANRAVSDQLNIILTKADAISGIITTMTKVADQTNLLSLNAAIEARKAGEYGSGFKVVAAEIRRLADQAASSTLDIETMITEMLGAVRTGVTSMSNLSGKVESGVREIATVTDHLGSVIQQVQGLPPRFELAHMAMQSQSDDAESIKDAVSRLSKSAQETVVALEGTAQKLHTLTTTTTELQSEISRFQT